MNLDRRQFALLLAAAGTTAWAQNGALPPGPFRTTQDAHADQLMLEGHDAVAYFTRNEAVRGDAAIQATHAGVTWRFASEANRAEFLRSPALKQLEAVTLIREEGARAMLNARDSWPWRQVAQWG